MVQFPTGCYSKFILSHSFLIYMLQYSSLGYIYASKSLSSILFPVDAERFIEKKRSSAQRRDSRLKPYSVPVIDGILNNISLKSYDISYRFIYSPKEHPLSGKQTFLPHAYSPRWALTIRFSGARGRRGTQPEGEILPGRMKLISCVGWGLRSYFTSAALKGWTHSFKPLCV